jgi:hypothetical protein
VLRPRQPDSRIGHIAGNWLPRFERFGKSLYN